MGLWLELSAINVNNVVFQFTKDTHHSKTMRDKHFALTPCLSGVSMKMTGRIIGVSGQSVMRRIKMFYENLSQKLMRIRGLKRLKLMKWFPVSVKKLVSGSGKLLTITLENLSVGNGVIAVPKP